MPRMRKATLGKRGETWFVSWRDFGVQKRKSFGKDKSEALKFEAKKTAELLDQVQGVEDKTWSALMREFKAERLPRLRPGTQKSYLVAFEHFERLIKPKRASQLSTRNLDKYASLRLQETGFGDREVSPATVNRELRSIKVLASTAFKWKYIPEKPEFNFLRESEDEPTFVSEAEFIALYNNCDSAELPRVANTTEADWWRAFLCFASLTGWRVSEILALRWKDVDLESGCCVTRAADNKGRRTVTTQLHEDVIQHIAKIRGFSELVFPWPHSEGDLYNCFKGLQASAGVEKTCTKDHRCLDACRFYGFHDLRRGFASINAGKLTAAQLQSLMRHKSYATTQRYISMAAQSREEIVSKLHSPLENRHA